MMPLWALEAAAHQEELLREGMADPRLPEPTGPFDRLLSMCQAALAAGERATRRWA